MRLGPPTLHLSFYYLCFILEIMRAKWRKKRTRRLKRKRRKMRARSK
ncbi:Ribosomal protein L41 [Penicillium roqueforti FM164]|uniref:60S ribosomal protein L41 n=1 Tax=Penicillium roqueforti (strain FM164) TaxID=1365484 RepID=W6QG82_PENRF|nr:Ribosomal protein L41 [Penicillium roqueforti FM164]